MTPPQLIRHGAAVAATILLLFCGTSSIARAQSLSPPASTAGPLTATGAALDVHTHIASQALTDRFTGGGVAYAGADDLIARLDEGNVQRAVILSAGYL